MDKGGVEQWDGWDQKDDLKTLAMRVKENYDVDFTANNERFDVIRRIQDLVGNTAYPQWNQNPGSSPSYIIPLLTAAAISFNAIAYPAILNDGEPVKCWFYGKDDGRLTIRIDPMTGMPMPEREGAGEKAAWANQYSQFANWQILKDIKHWKEELDKMTTMLPMIGCMFKKTYPNNIQRDVQSDLLMPYELIVHPSVKSLATAPRISHVFEMYRHECETMIASGAWLDVDISKLDSGSAQSGVDPEKKVIANDAPLVFIEQHLRYDLDGDGYAEPVIATVHKESGLLVKYEKNYIESDAIKDEEGNIIFAAPIQYFTKFGMFRDPNGSIYDIGFGTIFYEQIDAINSAINMLLDSAQRSNLHTGLIGKGGVRMQGGAITLKEGNFAFVESYGANLRDNIVELTAKEPSMVLFQLLGFMTDYFKSVVNMDDVVAANQTATTTLSMVEQGIAQYKAILNRIRDSLDMEIELMMKFNVVAFRKPNPFNIDFETVDESPFYTSASFDVNNLTSSIRIAKMQVMTEMCNGVLGDQIDKKEVVKEAFDTMHLVDPERFIAKEEPTPAEIQLKQMEEENKRLLAQLELQTEQNKNLELQIKDKSANADVMLKNAKALETLSKLEPSESDQIDDLKKLAEIQNLTAPKSEKEKGNESTGNETG